MTVDFISKLKSLLANNDPEKEQIDAFDNISVFDDEELDRDLAMIEKFNHQELDYEESELLSALFQDESCCSGDFLEDLKTRSVQLELAMKKNNELQRKLFNMFTNYTKLDDFQVDMNKRTVSKSYFATQSGMVPPENADVAKRKLAEMIKPIRYRYYKWNDFEREQLRRAVKVQNQRLLMSNFLEGLKQEFGISSMDEIDLKCNPEFVQRIRVGMNKLSAASDLDLESNLDGIDWEWIMKNYCPRRSSTECKIQWTINQHPLINNSDWTRVETCRLQEIIDANGTTNWPKIASELNTNRTATQCLIQYQRKMNKDLLRTKWTKKEDQMLKRGVEIYGEGNWQEIASLLENRTGQQCLHRWLKTLDPKIKRGKWSSEEDKLLLAAVMFIGVKNWFKVQKYVPGRTDVQCRERYMNVLNPELNSGPWTMEEDEKLVALIFEQGTGKWANIASKLSPRTDNQGVSTDQDYRFGDKQKKQLLATKFPKEYETVVDMTLVNLDVLRPWIIKRSIYYLGIEDEVVINMIFNLLEETNKPDPRKIQLDLTGFFENKSTRFVLELWKELIKAQEGIGGISKETLELKQKEILQKKVEEDFLKVEIRKARERETSNLEGRRQSGNRRSFESENGSRKVDDRQNERSVEPSSPRKERDTDKRRYREHSVERRRESRRFERSIERRSRRDERSRSIERRSRRDERSGSRERSRRDARSTSRKHSRKNERSRSNERSRRHDRSRSNELFRRHDRSRSNERSRRNERSQSNERSRRNDRSNERSRRSRSGHRSPQRDLSRLRKEEKDSKHSIRHSNESESPKEISPRSHSSSSEDAWRSRKRPVRDESPRDRK